MRQLFRFPIRTLTASLTLLAPLSTPATADEGDVAALVQSIHATVQHYEDDGLCGVLLIRAGNRLLLHEAYGMADRETGREMTTDTGFCIGSLVKPITAVAVLRLDQDGQLSIDDPLSRFFPNAPKDKRRITVRQMLRHQAGLDDLFGGDYDVVSRDWLLEKIMSADLISRPGDDTRYSNAGYSLLAMIIEDVSGQPYEEYVREHVLRPAGTPQIGYVLPGWKARQLAAGYRGLDSDQRWGTPLDHPWAKDGPGWNLRGNGGMLATAQQMCQWYEALFDGKLLDEQHLNIYLDMDAGGSKERRNRALGHAGGNGIFNTLQESEIDCDVHLTFFTSTTWYSAEKVWPELKPEFHSIVREYRSRQN